MPYLKVTCPELDAERRATTAARVTEAVNDLFYNPRGPTTREQLRERTTIHFTPYAERELFIGGRTPTERGALDLTVELSDWGMSVRQRRRVARRLTPVLADLFDVPSEGVEGINIRFHPYPTTDFAVGGRLLSDLVPRVGRRSSVQDYPTFPGAIR
ncbi:MAG TPA: hypothetical protein VE219_02850 [Candidatus Sulfotelmatobacter sp.]|nr:hypothetical protein [Candidatus Sulfotelmatobacter sp.]